MSTPPAGPTPTPTRQELQKFFGIDDLNWDSNCTGHQVLSALTHGYVVATRTAQLERERDEAVELTAALRATVVNTIGGTVDGAPTHGGNYLQRLRELVKTEQERADRTTAMNGAISSAAKFCAESEDLRTRLTAAESSTQQLTTRCAEFEGEVAQAKKERDGLHELHNKNAVYRADLLDTCTALRADVARLKEDKERLDWLETKNRYTPTNQTGAYRLDFLWFHSESMRQAIDQARAATPSTQSK